MSLQQLLSCKNSEIENLQAQLLSSTPGSVDSADRGIAFSPQISLYTCPDAARLMFRAI